MRVYIIFINIKILINLYTLWIRVYYIKLNFLSKIIQRNIIIQILFLPLYTYIHIYSFFAVKLVTVVKIK